MYYIYRHIRRDTDEVFYIGKGKTNSNRCLSKQSRSKYWHNIVNKNNGKYDVEIVMSNLTHHKALSKEIELIELYGRKLDGGTLCNLSIGGESGMHGCTHSKYTKNQMSKSAKGRKRTEEHRLNLSKSCKGVPKNREIPILKETQEKAWKANERQVICEETNIIYSSLKEAAKAKGVKYSTMKSRMQRNSKINTLRYTE